MASEIGLPVSLSLRPEGAEVRVPAHAHEVPDCEGEGQMLGLGDGPHGLGQVPSGPSSGLPSANSYLARAGRTIPINAFMRVDFPEPLGPMTA